MQIPPSDHQAKTFPGQMCGRVDVSSPVDGLTIKMQAAKTGYAGFCTGNDPEDCLKSVFSGLGFTDKAPWPRMPLFLLWRSEEAAPANASDVVKYLGSAPFDVEEPSTEAGTATEYQIDNISGCEGAECPSFPEAVDTTNGKGIGWFLELSVTETPKPETKTQSETDGAKGTDSNGS
jgi:hypothetical protein